MADLGVKRGYVVVGEGLHTRIGSDVEIIPWQDVVLRRFDFGLGTRRAARTRGVE
ncbi:MAG: hypothetical protein IPI67_42355 [Myxococcales bacterium]|nr:hypothetical protein [Myxococcales bacterium]